MAQQHEDVGPDRLAEVARLQEIYQATVESGCIEKAQRARATLNDFLAAIGSDDPEAEEHLRKALNFPLPRSCMGP
jgi:hypothetical protein